MSRVNIERLGQLTDAVYRGERAKLAQLQSREAGIFSQLAELHDARTRARCIDDSKTFHAGADVLWQTWIDQRREILNIELAQVRAGMLIQQDVLRKAFGRSEATNAIILREKSKEKLLRSRRADQMS